VLPACRVRDVQLRPGDLARSNPKEARGQPDGHDGKAGAQPPPEARATQLAAESKADSDGQTDHEMAHHVGVKRGPGVCRATQCATDQIADLGAAKSQWVAYAIDADLKPLFPSDARHG